MHPTHLFALGLGSELGLGVDFVRIRTTLSLSLSSTILYKRTHSLPDRLHSQKTKSFSFSPKTLNSHTTHIHTLSLSLFLWFCSVSLCFQTHFRTKFPRLKTEYSVFSRWRSKIKKPLFGKSSPRIGESWYNTSFFSLFYFALDSFFYFLRFSLLGLLNVLCFTWIGYKWFFFFNFFLTFFLNCYGFWYLGLIEILGFSWFLKIGRWRSWWRGQQVASMAETFAQRELLRSMQVARWFPQEWMQYVLLGLHERCSLLSLSQSP